MCMEPSMVEEARKAKYPFDEENVRILAEYFEFKCCSRLRILDIKTRYTRWRIVHDGFLVKKVFHKNNPRVLANNMRRGEFTYHQHEDVRVDGLFEVMKYISEHEKNYMN